MRPTIQTLFLSAIPGIVILCSGCQEKEVPAEKSADAANVTEISNNLDLEVVISLFGESKDLEDFEKKLNEPDRQVSNLDLNEDGEVDYLRVVESSKDQTHLVNVQAVTGPDQYQDVASFDVQRDPQGQAQVQVVGDPYVYGPNYAIRPAFSVAPLIVGWLCGSSYRSWNSPYSWGRYPSYYRPWRPYLYTNYRDRVSRYRNPNYSYNYGPYQRNGNSVVLYNQSRRNDYASKHPGKSFSTRNKGVENRYVLDQKKGKTKGVSNKGSVSSQKAAKPSKSAVKQVNPAGNKSKPANKPAKPATKSPGKSGGKQPKQSGKKDKGKK